MSAIPWLALKDLRILWRDKFGLFWVVAFPLLMALFFGSIFSGGGSGARRLRVAFVAGKASPEAARFRDELSKSNALTVQEMPLDSARDLVARGKLTAYVEYLDTSVSTSGGLALNAGSYVVGIDPSRKAEAGYLEGILNQVYFSTLQTKLTDPTQLRAWIAEGTAGIDTATTLRPETRTFWQGTLRGLDSILARMDDSSSRDFSERSPFQKAPIQFKDITVSAARPRSSWEITFPQSLQWALIGCAAAFALSMVSERVGGTYHRLRLAPISRAQILAGKGLACFIACVSVTTALMLFGILVFNVQVASPGGLALAILSAAICFVGLMMLISVLGKTQQAVGGAGWAILLVMSMTGGGMVPLMAMPDWLSSIGSISPVKWSILALEGAVWRGFTMSQIWQPVSILLGVGVTCFTVGTIIMRRSDL